METQYLKEQLKKYLNSGRKEDIASIRSRLAENNISSATSEKFMDLLKNFNRYLKAEEFAHKMRLKTDIFRLSKEIGFEEELIIGLLRNTPISSDKEDVTISEQSKETSNVYSSQHIDEKRKLEAEALEKQRIQQEREKELERERIRKFEEKKRLEEQRQQEEQRKLDERRIQEEQRKLEEQKRLKEQKKKVATSTTIQFGDTKKEKTNFRDDKTAHPKKKTKLVLFAILALVVVGFGMLIFGNDNSDGDETTQKKYSAKGNYEIMSKVRERGTLRVAFEANSAPMYFDDGDGGKDGFEVVIAKRISRQLDVKLEFVEEDYSKLPDVVLSDVADIFMGGYIADSNIKSIEWSNPYLDDIGFCLIAPKSSSIKSISDLKGKKVGIYADKRAREWVEANVDASEIKEYETEGNWVQFCDNPKEVDAIIYDYPYAVEEIKEFPELRIKEVGLGSFSYQIGVPEQNSDLLKVINGVIASFKDTEEYSKQIKKYLKSDALDVKEIEKGKKTYRVKPNETLSLIASKELGSVERWREIWNLNKSRIPNPNLIEVNDELIMP